MVRAITTSEMLAAWEEAYGLGVVAKGVTLLALAEPHESLERLLEWPIGARDAALLALRAQLFGQELKSLAACPACGEQLELDFCVDEIRVDRASGARSDFEASCGDRQLTLRLPTSADLLVLERLPTHHARRRELLRRCVQSCEAAAADELSEAEASSLSDQLAEHDPQADIRLSLSCAKCEHAWSARFDIVSYLWKEMNAWAQRLLAEVHLLASAYGWSEREIVGLSPWRRQIYLEMLRQ